MENEINVISLFDGMSVAHQALKELDINVNSYFASEIDPYAIAVTQSKFPETIQLGSVVDIKIEAKNNPLNKATYIDLLIGGSPCQDLSIAKKGREGLKGSRSSLFYEYVRIRDEVKPEYFILENVASMPKEARDTISEVLGVQPVMINASLVSAQNRKRLFWCGKYSSKTGKYEQVEIPQPEDKGILLKDILEENVDESFFIKKDLSKVIVRKYEVDTEKLKTVLREHKNLTNKEISEKLNIPITKVEHWFRTDSSFAIPDENIWYKLKELLKIQTDEFDKGIMEFEIKDNKYQMAERVHDVNLKSPTVATSGIVRIGEIGKGGQGDRIYSTDGKSVNLSANGGGRGAKTGLYGIKIPEATKKGYALAQEGDSVDLSFPNSTTRRGRVGDKVKNLMTSQNIGVVQNMQIRKLTPIECLRLQSMPDDYFDRAEYKGKPISNSQKYKMCGNAFNKEVVKYIISFLKF